MAQDRAARQRVKLWLGAEKAMGSDEVRMPRASAKLARLAVSVPNLPTTKNVTQLLVNSEDASEPARSASNNTPFNSPIQTRPEKHLTLSVLNEKEVTGCTRCRLHEQRTQTVFGEGDVDAKIFFIGEGPGENEDLQGRPFVGRAGELLNKMIAGMGLARGQVYIANIVKCRPPGNRQPAPDEVETCTPYLVRQLEVIRPQVIVTLGLPAAKYMLQSSQSMGRMRGQWHSWRGIRLMPTYHPAYLLRAYTEENRAAVWSDLKQVMAEVGLSLPAKKT